MVKWNGFLPLGSVVLLNGSDKRMQIVGQIQADAATLEVYDYAAIPFPEGYIDENQLAMFQHEEIRLICAVGHLDDGVWAFLEDRRKLREKLRDGSVTIEELVAQRSAAGKDGPQGPEERSAE